MPRLGSARRYAQAVFELAAEASQLDEWLDDLTYLAGALESDRFGELLDSPQASEQQKAGMIRAALGDRVGPLALNLVSILALRSVTYLLPEIADRYERLLDAHRGMERAEVVSAVPLDDGQRARIEEMLRGIVGKEIRMSSRVDPEIVGGFVARVGDRVIDGSAAGRLRRLRRELVGDRR